MSRISAQMVSYIMHPLFMVGYMLLFLIQANPYIFGFSDAKAKGLVLISVFTIAILFPMIAILLMKALGLISSIEMPDKKERIGPLIVTGLFYLWLYVNIRNNDNIPLAFSFFMLGSTIAVFMALIINSFIKISLHTIAAGGFLMAMLILVYDVTYGFVDFPVAFLGFEFRLSDRMILVIVSLLAGVTGTARLYLKSHLKDEIYLGYLIGIFSQLVAYRIFF
ncbi:MAG: hypothetical protein J5I52_12385 [Saprospiraceae bacterium]|nr:hypothetical protein [Saprospiraceae bacterium]